MSHSETLFSRAEQVIPGGVNSPVRAFRGVGGNPVFFKQGNGAYLTDVDGKNYIDYVNSWGPCIAGHAHPILVKAVQNAVAKGLTFGAPTEIEVLLAEKICELIPSIEMVRMVNSGTEAAISVIRLARGFTGRNKIVKFIGGYHGHCDSLLAKSGTGALTFSLPDSAGVPAAVTQDTLLAHFNDLSQVTQLFEQHGQDIAAIIVEPIAGNMNLVLPQPGFLAGLRQLCDQHGSLLIFDEVITGFRVGKGGAQSRFNIKPDLTMLGKIIGGGMPVGAYGGRRDIMEHLAPIGTVYQAGTLSGNPIAMTAGLTLLDLISAPDFYFELEKNTQLLVNGIQERANAASIPVFTQHCGSMFGLFFTEQSSIENLDHVKACNVERYKEFFHGMLNKNIYFAPSAFEIGFLSIAHQAHEIDLTLDAVESVFATMKKVSSYEKI